MNFVQDATKKVVRVVMPPPVKTVEKDSSVIPLLTCANHVSMDVAVVVPVASTLVPPVWKDSTGNHHSIPLLVNAYLAMPTARLVLVLDPTSVEKSN